MNLKLFFLFFFLILNLTQQSTLNTLNARNYFILFSECICDVTDQCDSQCCCDINCNSKLISQWKTYNLCLDDSLGIPFCQKITNNDKNVLDLHSGLRTIYSVIKRLFCINSVHFIQPSDWYKISVSQTELERQLSSQTYQSQSINNKKLDSLGTFNIKGLPLKNSHGLCKSSTKLIKNQQKSASCRVFIESFSQIDSTMLSIAKIQADLGVALNKYTTKSASSISAVKETVSTSCPTSSCTNVIRQLRIFIDSKDGSINSNSYVVVGPLTINKAGYISIKYEYSLVSTLNSQIQFAYSSYKGYSFGSKLNLVYKNNSNYLKMFNSFNLAFRKPDGTCRTNSTDQSVNSFVQLVFGENQFYSCIGTSNLISQNIISVFNMIGKYGLSADKVEDYVTVSSQTLSNTQSVQILIYYLNMGIPNKPQYQIQKVQIKPATTKNGISNLYVQYVNAQNKQILYVPPAPTVDAYLPNDFLYPFYVA